MKPAPRMLPFAAAALVFAALFVFAASDNVPGVILLAFVPIALWGLALVVRGARP